MDRQVTDLPAAPGPAVGRRTRVAAVLVVLAAAGAVLVGRAPRTSEITASAVGALRFADRGARGVDDGAIPAGTTVLDDDVPGVARLAPALRGTLRRAASAAAVDGVVLVVDSGWRSAAYQARLRREAVATYGSEAEAARWVATPESSAHVSGDAVDLAPAAADWLSRRGADFDLCRTYANEPWHWERRPGARERGCPPMYADPTEDPRMRR